jgi:hypothetical protein
MKGYYIAAVRRSVDGAVAERRLSSPAAFRHAAA